MSERVHISEGGVREIFGGLTETARRRVMESLYSKIRYGSDEAAIELAIVQLHHADPCDRCGEPMEIVKLPNYDGRTKEERMGILRCPCAQQDPEGTGGRGLDLLV